MSVVSKALTEKLTLREKIQVSLRLLQEISRLDKRFIPLSAIQQFLSVAAAYIGIYISTMILNQLTEKVSVKQLLIKVIFWTGLCFVIHLVTGWLSAKNDVIKNSSWDRMHIRRNIKTMEMDFPDLESPYINELYHRMQEDNNWGSGIYGGYQNIEFIFYQLFNMIFAIGMLIPIMNQLWQGKSGITYLFFAVLVVMVVLNSLGETYFGERLTKCMQQWPENEPEKINLMWYFAFYDGLTPQNRKDIKLYDAKSLLEEYVIEHGKEFLKDKEEQMARESGRRALVGSVFGTGVTGVCYFFLTLMAVAGGVTAGMLVRYVSCFQRLTTSLQALIRDSQSFLLVARRQSSIFEFLDAEGKLYQGSLPVEKRSDNEYEIEFRNVSFKYPGNDVYALKNFSLKIRIGERMALVGKNGSGKTTMIKLLCRLYDPTEGEILVNGVDIRKFDYQEYMQLFSVVFQDFTIFGYTVAENVAANEEYDAEKVKECLIKAGFGQRLEELEMGIETFIGEEYDNKGIKMSGGECQKIAIARALYRNSPFILLDEPTAALDPVAEFEVYSAFNEMVGSKTAIYISHRLSSCRFCNDIVVFDSGRIVQRGNHKELMGQQEGLYRELWEAQARYYEKKHR